MGGCSYEIKKYNRARYDKRVYPTSDPQSANKPFDSVATGATGIDIPRLPMQGHNVRKRLLLLL